MNKALAFINPGAGSLRGCSTPEEIKHKFQRLRYDTDISIGNGNTAMATFVQKVKKVNPEVVIIAGGDGTVSCIMKQLFGADTVFGIVPTGSINNIARSIGLSGDFEEAIDAINSGNVGELDVAKAGEIIIMESIGVGYLANIMQRIGEQDSSKDVLNVIKHTLAESLDPPEFEVKLIADGKEIIIETGWLTISNLGKAAAVEINPKAKPDDGRLSITYFLPLSLTEMPQYMLQTFRGDHLTLPKVRTITCRRASLNLPSDTVTHFDDKITKRSRVDVEVLPAAYKVYVS